MRRKLKTFSDFSYIRVEHNIIQLRGSKDQQQEELNVLWGESITNFGCSKGEKKEFHLSRNSLLCLPSMERRMAWRSRILMRLELMNMKTGKSRLSKYHH